MKKIHVLILLLCLVLTGCNQKKTDEIQSQISSSDKIESDVNQSDDIKQDELIIENNKNDEYKEPEDDSVSVDEKAQDDSDTLNHEVINDDSDEETALNITTELTTPAYDPNDLPEENLIDPDELELPKPGLLGPDQLGDKAITFVHDQDKLEDVTFDDTINVYVFWGNRCAHCTHLIEYLESLLDEDPELFKLYTFEVWHDEENKAILDEIALMTKEEVAGVPYMIIGDDVFVGYDEVINEDILDSIDDRHRHDYIYEWLEDELSN